MFTDVNEKERRKNIRKTRLVRWEVLLINYVKINFDGSVISGRVGICYIIRDYYGRMIVVRLLSMGERIVLFAEIITLRGGVSRESNKNRIYKFSGRRG